MLSWTTFKSRRVGGAITGRRPRARGGIVGTGLEVRGISTDMAPWGSMGLTGREGLTDLGATDRRLPRLRIIPAIIIGTGGRY